MYILIYYINIKKYRNINYSFNINYYIYIINLSTLQNGQIKNNNFL